MGQQRQNEYDSGHEDGEISRAQKDKLAKDVFEKSLNALTNADFDKTTKVLGFLEVPTGVVDAINSGYNVLSQFAGDFVRPRAQSLMLKYGSKWLKLEGTTLTRAAALAAIGSDIAVKGANYFGGVWNAYKERQQAFAKLAASVAPVLDDIKGKHTVSALNSVSEAQNEVIYAHRRRIAKITGARTKDSWIDFAINTAPNVLMEAGEWKGTWEGKSIKDMRKKAWEEKQAKYKEGEISEDSPMGMLKHYFKTITNGTTAQIARYFKKYNDHHLNKNLPPYSALEMILELNKQVANKSTAHSFTLPRGVDGKGGQSVPLEEFVVRVIVQHQKDMAWLNPEHTEIREALQDDVMAVAKPIAEAIRKGQMSALELVRLVGEGKIIKGQGRAIAAPEDVMAAMKADAPKQESYAHIDPKKYWANANHNAAQEKQALEALEGNERQMLIAMTPHNIRKDVGVAEEESKAVDAAMPAARYDRAVADMVLGVAAQSDEALERAGLAKKEIALDRKAAEMIKREGVEKAVPKLKMGPANDHGIEHVITNFAVPQITGDKAHQGRILGDLMAKGHDEFEKLAAHKANDDSALHDRGKGPKTFAGQHAGHAANDHAGREHDRRATGTDGNRHHDAG